jgi:two-component system cell cycle response regulator DivK
MGYRILVVDDHEVNRQLVSLLLTRAGHEVTEAESGTAALAWLGRARFDAVLLDISMPEMSGPEVLEHIRSNEATCGLRVVAYTAHAQEGDRKEMLAQGFDAVLTKPISRQSLMDSLAPVAKP